MKDDDDYDDDQEDKMHKEQKEEGEIDSFALKSYILAVCLLGFKKRDDDGDDDKIFGRK